MEDGVAAAILKELREFRAENNQKWEVNDERWKKNDKRWEENDRRWKENDKRWDENQKSWNENQKRWEENQKSWNENQKRWEENQKSWDENQKRWEENQKSWDENQKRWEKNQKNWDENQNSLREMNIRIAKLELNREKDRKELFEVLDNMQKSITQQMSEMREYFDIKFAKMDAAHRAYEVQNNQMLQMIYTHEKRLGFYDSRIQRLENWKDEFDMGEFSAV